MLGFRSLAFIGRLAAAVDSWGASTEEILINSVDMRIAQGGGASATTGFIQTLGGVNLTCFGSVGGWGALLLKQKGKNTSCVCVVAAHCFGDKNPFVPVGSTATFNGETRSVVGGQLPSAMGQSNSEFTILILESDLPESCVPAQVLSDDNVNAIDWETNPIPFINQYSGNIHVYDCDFSGSKARPNRLDNTPSADPARSAFGGLWVSGRSSSPCGLVYKNRIIALGPVSNGDVNDGDEIYPEPDIQEVYGDCSLVRNYLDECNIVIEANNAGGYLEEFSDTAPTDTTPPVVSSATIATNGTTLTLILSEPCLGTNTDLTLSGGFTATFVSKTGTARVYTVSPTVLPANSLTFSKPSTLTDHYGNVMAAITNQAVTNNSTASGDPGGTQWATSSPDGTWVEISHTGGPWQGIKFTANSALTLTKLFRYINSAYPTEAALMRLFDTSDNIIAEATPVTDGSTGWEWAAPAGGNVVLTNGATYRLATLNNVGTVHRYVTTGTPLTRDGRCTFLGYSAGQPGAWSDGTGLDFAVDAAFL